MEQKDIDALLEGIQSGELNPNAEDFIPQEPEESN